MTRGARAAWSILIVAAGVSCRAAPAPSRAGAPPVDRVPWPRLAFETSPVTVEGPFGASSSKDVRLTGELARAVQLSIAGVEGDVVVAGLLPPGATRAAGVRLTLSGRRAGQGVGSVVVATGLQGANDPKQLVLYFGWKVPGNLTVTPSNPYLNLRLPGPHVVEISVASSRPDFRLQRAEVVAGPFAARVARRGGAGPYTVEVRVVESDVAGGRRGFAGKLVLVSNDPAEPRKEIPLLAMGALNPIDARPP